VPTVMFAVLCWFFVMLTVGGVSCTATSRIKVPIAVRSMKTTPIRTSFESPWHNEVGERWLQSCRRDLLRPRHRAERGALKAAAQGVRKRPDRSCSALRFLSRATDLLQNISPLSLSGRSRSWRRKNLNI
jgi:hypothetical protein